MLDWGHCRTVGHPQHVCYCMGLQQCLFPATLSESITFLVPLKWTQSWRWKCISYLSRETQNNNYNYVVNLCLKENRFLFKTDISLISSLYLILLNSCLFHWTVNVQKNLMLGRGKWQFHVLYTPVMLYNAGLVLPYRNWQYK